MEEMCVSKQGSLRLPLFTTTLCADSVSLNKRCHKHHHGSSASYKQNQDPGCRHADHTAGPTELFPTMCCVSEGIKMIKGRSNKIMVLRGRKSSFMSSDQMGSVTGQPNVTQTSTVSTNW